jgi:hypothetical protein
VFDAPGCIVFTGDGIKCVVVVAHGSSGFTDDDIRRLVVADLCSDGSSDDGISEWWLLPLVELFLLLMVSGEW